MKKALVGCMALMLFLAAGVVLAQQATTPAAAPAAPASKASAPAAPSTPSAPAAPSAAPAPTSPAPAAKAAAPASSLTISRMDIASSVDNRQPVGIAATFPASQEKVFCYVELKDVPKDTTITFAWTYGNDTDKVTQQIKKSSRWRTWGNKSLAGRIGDWKVDVLDESGEVLQSAAFKVE